MEYNNPNDNWRKRQNYYRKEQESGEIIKIIVKTLLVCLAFALFGWLLSGCTTTKYVPVPEVHEHWHHQTDTIMRTDSIIDHQQIIIREVDSATMAQYGIELKDMQRAWLIENNRLRKQLSELIQSRKDTTIVRDTIPKPYPVEVRVPAELTQWQQFRLSIANLLLYAIGAMTAWFFLKKCCKK